MAQIESKTAKNTNCVAASLGASEVSYACLYLSLYQGTMAKTEAYEDKDRRTESECMFLLYVCMSVDNFWKSESHCNFFKKRYLSLFFSLWADIKGQGQRQRQTETSSDGHNIIVCFSDWPVCVQSQGGKSKDRPTQGQRGVEREAHTHTLSLSHSVYELRPCGKDTCRGRKQGHR